MKTTLDRFGRLVIPKDIRDRLGLRPGAELEIDEKKNVVVLKPVEHEPSLTLKAGVLVLSGKATGDVIYPGGGYFYTNHPFLGAGDALVETVLIVMVLMGLMNMLSGVPEKAVGPFQFIFFGFLLVLEKLYSVYHAKHYVKEYIPMETNFQPLKKG